MKNYEMNHIEKIVSLSPSFLKKASQLGTAEYHDMLRLRRELPDYKFEAMKNTTQRKANKSKNLTYKHMADYINATYGKDTKEGKEALAQLDKVQKLSLIQKNPYLYVRDWFIKTYPDCRPTDDKKAEQETTDVAQGA